MKKEFIFLSGALITTILLSKPFLLVINGFNLFFSSKSLITYNEEANFFLLLEAWLLVGILWWLMLQIISGLVEFLFSFLICWSSILFFFTFFNYWLALPFFLIFSSIIILA